MQAIDIFIKNIKALMEATGISQAELSTKSTVDRAGISLYLSRKKEPSIGTCEKIAAVFGISLSEAFNSGKKPDPRIEKIEVSDQIQKAIEEGIKRGLSFLPSSPLSDASAEPLLQRVISKVSQLDRIRLTNLEGLIDRQLARQHGKKEDSETG